MLNIIQKVFMNTFGMILYSIRIRTHNVILYLYSNSSKVEAFTLEYKVVYSLHPWRRLLAHAECAGKKLPGGPLVTTLSKSLPAVQLFTNISHYRLLFRGTARHC